MPATGTRYTRKRKTYKRKTFRKRTTRVPRPYMVTGTIESPVKNSQVCVLKYCDTAVLAPETVPNSFDIKANSLYDPLYTLGGHQPNGYDQMMTLYNKWVVLSSTIKVRFLPGAITNHTALCGVRLSETGSSFPTGYVQALEMTPKWDAIVNVADNGMKGYSYSKYDARKEWKIKSPFDNNRLFGQITTDLDEAECLYYSIWVAGIDDATEIGNIIVVYEVDYTVCFFEPKTTAPS